MKAKLLIPLGLFIVLVAFLGIGLGLNPHEVPSPLINKPAPTFSLPLLERADAKFSPDELKGKVWLLNVWASWCPSCKEEHPVLMEFARRKMIPIVGLDYKDKREKALDTLRYSGNPYDINVFDVDGRVAIDYGVYGAPESYLIDKDGIIRYKHIGPITAESLRKTIIPLITELQKS